MTTTRLLAETEQLTESGASSGDAPVAEGRNHRVTTEPVRFRRKPEYVDAVQLTKEAVEAHVLDGSPLPDGCRLTSARCHRGNRTVDFAAALTDLYKIAKLGSGPLSPASAEAIERARRLLNLEET